jgi:hypothetical protein
MLHSFIPREMKKDKSSQSMVDVKQNIEIAG